MRIVAAFVLCLLCLAQVAAGPVPIDLALGQPLTPQDPDGGPFLISVTWQFGQADATTIGNTSSAFLYLQPGYASVTRDVGNDYAFASVSTHPEL